MKFGGSVPLLVLLLLLLQSCLQVDADSRSQREDRLRLSKLTVLPEGKYFLAGLHAKQDNEPSQLAEESTLNNNTLSTSTLLFLQLKHEMKGIWTQLTYGATSISCCGNLQY